MTLRSARIQRGLTIEQVAQDTRISARFLEALENEAFQELPAPVYVRGFLRSYANYLRLDPAPLLVELPEAQGGGEAALVAPPEPPSRDGRPRRGADPFRPAAPARPQVIGEEFPGRVATVPGPDPFSTRRAESETPLDAAYAAPYRSSRVGGVLVERGAVYEDNGRIVRFAALVGGGLVILALFVIGAMALGGGGDGDGTNVLAGDDTPAPTGTRNPIVVGSTTPTGSATADGSTTPEPGTTPTATSTPDGDSTATPTSEAGTPTATPTLPAPTQPPPTATPTTVPPTPTPTLPPPPPYGALFNECPQSSPGQPDCGAPMTVVCPPGQVWFVDYGNDFPAATYGYPTTLVNTNGEAINAGNAGCV
ncbi:MAG: helix-turn-helix transcriptional regulator [Dehalococcoidia bacterium]